MPPTRKPEVVITAQLDGSVTIEAAAIKGHGCKALTLPYEQALGVVSGDRIKPDYHLTQQQGQQATQH